MSATLCPMVPMTFLDATNTKAFFGDNAFNIIKKKSELVEQPLLGVPGKSCQTNLFFGFFFDGTKNNYVLAEKPQNQSNVARLYDCYPGQSVPGVLPGAADWTTNPDRYKHFFKVYVPGVASPFKEINDSGEGAELTRGAAAGYRGEARILWGLFQAINNVHRFFLKVPLLSPAETQSLIYRIELGRRQRRRMKLQRRFGQPAPNEEDEKTRIEFERILKRLHAAIKPYWPVKSTGKPAKTDPAQVMKIYISTFGFSRGATQARAFTNWLMSLCGLDAQLCGRTGLTLGGFDVQFDFLGLFDTVASVGAGNTLGNSFLGRLFDGHGAWADAEDSLRIPSGIRCLHLVAAHEIRRSFPLDSIAVGQVTQANCEEIVVPGVHSDLGCGYCPKEQGRGVDASGADMLSRIPLLLMYKEARLAGVPLKLELATPKVKEKFRVVPETIKALNQYLATCKVHTGTLTAIMREQGKHHILWHRTRRASGKTPLENSPSFIRASNFDKNDLHSANLEFEQEIALFEAWLSGKEKGFVPKSQMPGFDNEHENEWEEIATWWNTATPLAVSTLDFFDNYVHDSRAWFKLIPGNPDNEPDLQKQLRVSEATRKKIADYNAREAQYHAEQQKLITAAYGKNSGMQLQPYSPVKDGLPDAERAAAQEFAKTGITPRTITAGREPFNSSWASFGLSGKAGYLRFRKIYAGGDRMLISDVIKSASVEMA